MLVPRLLALNELVFNFHSYNNKAKMLPKRGIDPR